MECGPVKTQQMRMQSEQSKVDRERASAPVVPPSWWLSWHWDPHGGRTTCLLSSAKVALTNMAPRAKPRLLSVSLMQNFQRGRQVCMGQRWALVVAQPKPLTFPPPCPARR